MARRGGRLCVDALGAQFFCEGLERLPIAGATASGDVGTRSGLHPRVWVFHMCGMNILPAFFERRRTIADLLLRPV